jgi:hypothetical protein
MSTSEQSFQDQENDTQQKNDNGDFIDTVHHLDIDVAWTRGIFLPEKISPHLTKGEKLSEPVSLFRLAGRYIMQCVLVLCHNDLN